MIFHLFLRIIRWPSSRIVIQIDFKNLCFLSIHYLIRQNLIQLYWSETFLYLQCTHVSWLIVYCKIQNLSWYIEAIRRANQLEINEVSGDIRFRYILFLTVHVHFLVRKIDVKYWSHLWHLDVKCRIYKSVKIRHIFFPYKCIIVSFYYIYFTFLNKQIPQINLKLLT